MATEEKSPTAPPAYSELILLAIDGLKEKSGSSQSAISDYIEAKHKNLPQDHADQLAENLKKLTDSGAIVLDKEKYLRPDISSPTKRGRGRPPKPKAPLPPDYVPPPPRPRGRPPKAGVAAAAPAKPRGRPPKKPRGKDAPPATTAPAAGVKRGRGRPPKAKPAVAAVGA